MDEKELKKLLEKELDHLAPPMSDKVRKAPIVTAKSDKPEKSVERKPDIKVKRFNVKPYVIGAIAAVLVIVISLALVLPPLFKGGKEQPAQVYEAGYLRMDINPSVEFVYDEDLKVTDIKSANYDADLLLTSAVRETVEGMPVYDAAAYVAEEAGKLGYIVPDKENALKLTVVAATDAQEDEVITKTTVAIETNFMKKGVLCAVVAVKEDVDYLAELYGAATDDLKDAVDKVVEKADNYFTQLAERNNNDLEELRRYYEEEVFEYLRSLISAECVRITRTRELLHEAKDLNDDISVYNAVIFGDDYWATIKKDDWKDDPELSRMIGEMSDILEKIAELRDEEINDGASLNLLLIAYDAFINEEWISEIGNAMIDELKGSMSYIIDKLEELNIFITDAIKDAIAEIPDTVQEFIDGTDKIVANMRAELEEIYLEVYEEERDALTREEYDEFYTSIISEYGSLEAYWQQLNAA